MIRGLSGRDRALLLVALTTLAAPVARAQEDKAAPRPPAPLPPPPAEIHLEGEYMGVVPGKGSAPGAAGLKQSKFPLLTWVGFQPLEGGSSRVFLQLTREVPFEQTVVNGTLVVSLAGARHGSRNARRFLDMRYFDSSLLRMESRAVPARRARRGVPARAAGIELRFSFKNPADARAAQARMSAAQDGYQYLLLELGPASPIESAAAPAPQ